MPGKLPATSHERRFVRDMTVTSRVLPTAAFKKHRPLVLFRFGTWFRLTECAAIRVRLRGSAPHRVELQTSLQQALGHLQGALRLPPAMARQTANLLENDATLEGEPQDESIRDLLEEYWDVTGQYLPTPRPDPQFLRSYLGAFEQSVTALRAVFCNRFNSTDREWIELGYHTAKLIAVDYDVPVRPVISLSGGPVYEKSAQICIYPFDSVRYESTAAEDRVALSSIDRLLVARNVRVPAWCRDKTLRSSGFRTPNHRRKGYLLLALAALRSVRTAVTTSAPSPVATAGGSTGALAQSQPSVLTASVSAAALAPVPPSPSQPPAITTSSPAPTPPTPPPPQRKRGRPPLKHNAPDVLKDAKFYDDWKTSGQTQTDFLRSRGVPVSEGKQQLDRARK